MQAQLACGTLESMKRALVVSLALHGVVGAALLSIDLRHGEGERSTKPIAIEIVAPPAIAPPVVEPPPPPVQGGGASKLTAAPRTQARRAKVKPSELTDYSIDRTGSEHAQPNGIDRDGDGGEGNGIGGNRGDGIGFGDGERVVLAEQLVMPAPPAAEKAVSKARPAKLIYPTRQRDLGEEKLFVARVTVDTDGYVVGARIVRGRHGPSDGDAADLIFRFRYLPALDDDGRAIRSTFEQPFHVNR